MDANALESTLNSLKTRWDIAKNQFISSYPNAMMDIEKSTNSRAYNSIISITRDTQTLEAQVKGFINENKNYFSRTDNQIQEVKNNYNNSVLDLKNVLGTNIAATPLKVDKYDQNSQSYILLSYYSISILTMSFFIYKQLKQ